MKTITPFVLSFLFSTSLSAALLRGVVKDSAGAPLHEATITIEGVRSVRSDRTGAFEVALPPGRYSLRVTHSGFLEETHEVIAGEILELTLEPSFSETMVVSAIRANENAPLTRSDISREEIEQRYHGEDVPLLLRDAPAVHAYTESGVGGSGYSYISLRGVSASRINFTLDGVPLADSEDMGTYFADFPDLARSLESVQIQRGVGTSTVGTPSFGGSVNLESLAIAPEQKIDITLGGGSFGGRQVSAGFHSGDLGQGFAFYTRVSYLESEGFREHSGVEQRNLFFSASKPVGSALLKLTGFSGHETQGLSFYATDAETLRANLRENPMSPDETDSFGYDLANLQYIRPLGADSDLVASAYYQRGYGWYRLRDYGTEVLRQFGLDGVLIGSTVTVSRSRGALSLNGGIHLNRFQREHTRDLVEGNAPRDYANEGIKNEVNAFAKAGYQRGRWHWSGDAQIRHSDFEYRGDIAITPVSWTFWNPKAGVRYATSQASSLYASFGMTTREPTRGDLFHGEDNPSIPYDLKAVRPERVYDVEAGWDYRAGSVEIHANAYAMEFRNEIAATGELSEMGLPLRRNVNRSYRRGVEIEASWQVTPSVRLETNGALSRNRIRQWTQFFDVYDEEGSWVEATGVLYRGVEPLLTPSVLVNQSVAFTPSPRLNLGAVGRYVGRSWLDNTNDAGFDAPAYFTADAKISSQVTSWARVSLHVNNIFDRREIFASGYSYRYFDGPVKSGTAYYYPQASRNVVVLLDFDL